MKCTFLTVTILVSTFFFSPTKPVSYFLNNYQSIVADWECRTGSLAGPLWCMTLLDTMQGGKSNCSFIITMSQLLCLVFVDLYLILVIAFLIKCFMLLSNLQVGKGWGDTSVCSVSLAPEAVQSLVFWRVSTLLTPLLTRSLGVWELPCCLLAGPKVSFQKSIYWNLWGPPCPSSTPHGRAHTCVHSPVELDFFYNLKACSLLAKHLSTLHITKDLSLWPQVQATGPSNLTKTRHTW